MKKLMSLILCIGLVLSLCACGSGENDVTTDSTAAPATTTNPNTTTKEEVTEPEATVPVTEDISDTAAPITPTPPPTAAPTEAPTEDTTIGKTGEMAFSDSPDNRYISAVADKYGVNSENLVAIYTVPQNDSNMVLEFSGEKDDNGKLIRDSSTLVAIYTIDAALNSQRASKDSSKNEYDTGEMMVMFITVTTYIMPEFENEL